MRRSFRVGFKVALLPLLCLTFLIAATSDAQVNQAAAARPANGPHEGIQVSGYWRIDIRNRNGSLARHVEFENALTTASPIAISGDYALATMLGGGYVASTPSIGLNTQGIGTGTAGNQSYWAPFLSAGPCSGGGCLLTASNSLIDQLCTNLAGLSTPFTPVNPLATVQSSQPYVSGTCNTGLSVAFPPAPSASYPSGSSSTGSAASLVLSGAITASSSSSITSVETFENLCQVQVQNSGQTFGCYVPGAGVSAETQGIGIPYSFTSYTIPSGIPVSAGQVINLSVTLSFSAVSSTGPTGSGYDIAHGTPTVVKARN